MPKHAGTNRRGSWRREACHASFGLGHWRRIFRTSPRCWNQPADAGMQEFVFAYSCVCVCDDVFIYRERAKQQHERGREADMQRERVCERVNNTQPGRKKIGDNNRLKKVVMQKSKREREVWKREPGIESEQERGRERTWEGEDTIDWESKSQNINTYIIMHITHAHAHTHRYILLMCMIISLCTWLYFYVLERGKRKWVKMLWGPSTQSHEWTVQPPPLISSKVNGVSKSKT